MSKPLKGFITYSHEDTAQKDELRKRLAIMEQQNKLVTWDDGQIIAGDKASQEEILKEVADSNLLFYLVSAASLDSRNCKKELDEALERDIKIIPIILEYCDWPHHQLSSFEVLPSKGKPISKWEDESEGWQNVVDGIRATLEKVKKQVSSSSNTSEESVAELVFQRGNVLMMLGQLDMAIRAYTHVIELNPLNADAYINRGAAYQNKNNFDLAIQDFNTATQLKPDDAIVYYNFGVVYSKKGEVDTAIKNYDRAIELNPNYAVVYSNRGNAYSKIGKTENAMKDYNMAIELNPYLAETYYNRGIDYEKKGEVNLAIKDYTTAIQLQFDYAEAYCNRGVAYAKINKVDLAISDYSLAIQLDPNYAKVYNNRGNAYSKIGEYKKAIEDYNKAIKQDPEFIDAYNSRGAAFSIIGEVERAIKDYNSAIQLNPDYAKAYCNRGNAYSDKGDHDRAIEDYSKAITLNPNFAEAYYNRGNTYNNNGEIDKAIKDYNKAITLKRNYVLAYYKRGIAYLNIGQFDRAIENYTTLIKLNSNDVNAYGNRGVAHLSKGEFDKAIKDYTILIELAPNDAGAHSNRGVAYFRKGEVKRAIENYNIAIALEPSNATFYFNRGEVWLHLQEWEKAKTDLTTAKRIGVDIIAAFHNSYRNVETFEQRKGFRLPEDLALLLTQRRRDRFPKKRRVLDADGNPIESPNVVNLRSQLRNAGIPLGDYVKTKPAFGINTTPTEAFVVDKATRDKLITAHPLSADILKPFLHGQDLRRWHVDTPQQWLIFAHRGIAINDYPAILKHLEKYRESLSKRKGKQEWYELPVSLGDAERFTQPKLVSPNTYNHQTFAVDTIGYYYGNTSYLIPTAETWLCGLLNSRTVEWFYSQVSNQLTIDPLRARSGYIQQIPIPDLTSTQKALIAKIVDYLIYLQQQPTTNSKDLKHARDAITLGYFERIIDGLVYEAYLPEDLHKGDKHFFQPLLDEQLPSCEEIQGDKMTVLRDIFELLYERTHLVRRNLYYLDSVKAVRIIEGKI